MCEAAAAVSRIEVCKTSKLSEGKFIKAFCHPFCAFTKRMEKFPIGNAIGGFAAIIAAKRRILLRQQQEKVAAKGGAKAHGVCRPGRDKLSEGKLQRRQGRRKRGRRAAKDLIGLVRSRCLGALIRGLQNLESSRKGKRIYSFRLYEKNQKYPRGLRTSGLRGRFKSPLDSRFLQK